MRWTALVLLVVGIAVALAPGAALAQTKLTWWEQANPPENEYARELASRWNRANPNATVTRPFP